MRPILVVALLLAAGTIAAAEPAETKTAFRAWDVFVESGGETLGAYQVEISYPKAMVKIVGVEGGEPEPFQEAPHYDPKGLKGDRLILAAFTTDTKSAPKGTVRVARIHMNIEGADTPQISAKLMTAADIDGKKIKMTARLAEAKPEEKGAGDEKTEE